MLLSFYGAEVGQESRERLPKTLREANINTYFCIYRECYKSSTRAFLYESFYPDQDQEYSQTDIKSWYCAWQLTCCWPSTARDLRENVYSPKNQLKYLTHMIRVGSKTVFYLPKFKAQKCKYNLKKAKTL